jgi:hypothetical protein
VLREGDEFVLRWSGFAQYDTADEVRQGAAVFIEILNGAMAIARSTRPLLCEAIVEFRSDGGRKKIKFAEARSEARSRAVATAVVLGPDGQIRPPPPPQESEVQQWLALGEKHQKLADALIYFARTGWFDAYKAIECLEDWAGGSERALLRKNWVPKKLKDVKQTANSFRHRRGGKHKPAPNAPTLQEAHEILAEAIRNAFAATRH